MTPWHTKDHISPEIKERLARNKQVRGLKKFESRLSRLGSRYSIDYYKQENNTCKIV
jgi:hypothetical protein